MTELRAELEVDATSVDARETRPLRLGFVNREPLDTMLRLERLPPPILSLSGASGTRTSHNLRTIPADVNKQKLQAVKMKLNLAELVLTSEQRILASGNADVIAGLGEVHQFLVHCEHLRLLQER